MELVFLVQIVLGQIWAEHQVQHELDRAAGGHVPEKFSKARMCERVHFTFCSVSEEWNRARQFAFWGGGERKRLLIKSTAAICIFSDVWRAVPGNLQPVLIWFTSDLFPPVKEAWFWFNNIQVHVPFSTLFTRSRYRSNLSHLRGKEWTV